MEVQGPGDVSDESFHTAESIDEPERDEAETTLAEPEFHTDESDMEDDMSEADMAKGKAKAPLLPAHLLQSLPSPVSSTQVVGKLPLDQMTRKERKALRSRSRQRKKRLYDRLRQESRGTGVIEAGKAAQAKRNVANGAKDRVRSGRVGKQPAKTQLSGRQKLLEDRKRAIQGHDAAKTAAKPKTRSKR